MTSTGYGPAIGSSEETGDQIFVAGPLTVDVGRYEARLDGREIRLAAREFELLVFLIRRRGLVTSPEEISTTVWHRPISTNTVTVHIKRLRTKLGDDPHRGVMIRTIRGVGYRLGPGLCEQSPLTAPIE